MTPRTRAAATTAHRLQGFKPGATVRAYLAVEQDHRRASGEPPVYTARGALAEAVADETGAVVLDVPVFTQMLAYGERLDSRDNRWVLTSSGVAGSGT